MQVQYCCADADADESRSSHMTQRPYAEQGLLTLPKAALTQPRQPCV